MNFSQEELKILSSNKAIQYLLQQEGVINFERVLRRIQYESRLKKLQAKLIQVQNQVLDLGKRVLVIFEGREFSGKGRTLNACTEHLNPRNYRKVALDKPTAKERAQWYFKRYIEQIPEKGEMVFFDRSWYNRAVVEPVNGFCTEKEYSIFMDQVNYFEEMLVEDGIIMLKFYLSISREVQNERIGEIRAAPLLRWKLSKVDLEVPDKWDSYTLYTEKMLEKTNGPKNPWHIIQADEHLEGVLEVFEILLNEIPFGVSG